MENILFPIHHYMKGATMFAATQQDSIQRDIGSAIALVFNEDWLLAVGHSASDQVWKFPGGKIEEKDIPPNFVDESFYPKIAEHCALRELEAETGISKNDLLIFHQLSYVRRLLKKDNHPSLLQKQLLQFHFLGMVCRNYSLAEEVVEQEEIDRREFRDPVSIFLDAFLRRGTNRKFNPYHAVALAYALRELKNKLYGEDAFESFTNMIRRLEQHNLFVEHLGDEILDKIIRREI